MAFKELFESPIRTGDRNSKDFSKEYEWDNTYKSSKFVDLLSVNFTSRNYKIYKSPTSIFVVDKNDNYKMSIEYTESKNPDVLRINIAHSKEAKLFGQFVFKMLNYYQYISSGDQQSTQAEKSWVHIINKANSVYADTGIFTPILKKDVGKLYNTSTRIAISEDVAFGYSYEYFEDVYRKKIEESHSFRKFVLEDPDGANDYLFPLSVNEGK